MWANTGYGGAGPADMTAPGPIGGTTPDEGTFTLLTISGVKEFRKSGSLDATTGTFNLPAVTTAGQGTLVLGANLYSAHFRVTGTGEVQLIDSDSGGVIVANADTALKVAIGDAAATNIIPITNRTAGALAYVLTFFYD